MLVESNMRMALGARAPAFTLPSYQDANKQGTMFALEQLQGPHATVVMFISNHCPFVVHIQSVLQAVISAYQKRGVGFIAIASNDITQYPEDGPEYMMKQGYTCPYLFDQDQSVAKAYNAACTPDFFIFDRDLACFYRGRFDGARPGNAVGVTGEDLCAALDACIDGHPQYSGPQYCSMGCNIKWRH